MKKKIKPKETVIYGDWSAQTNNLTQKQATQIAHRIYWLMHHYLEEIFDDGWEKLYKDPKDHRYWELTYPKSYMHGGGPPLLRHLTDEEATTKYKIGPQYIPEMKIKPEETAIDISSDHLTLQEIHNISSRIHWLTRFYLREVFVDGHEVLYRDPNDNRYWELTDPEGYSEGVMPGVLKYLPDEEAAAKYPEAGITL